MDDSCGCPAAEILHVRGPGRDGAAGDLAPATGLHPTHMLTASEVTETASGLVGPQGIFCVKGYTRSLAAFTVMVACRECPCIMEAWVALKVISDFLWFPSLLM